MPLSQFLDEIRGFLVSNGVSKEIDQDNYIRTVIKNNHYAIHNYLVEHKERTTFRHMLAEDFIPSFYGKKIKTEKVKKPTKYLDRLKKRFPELEDNDDELILDEAPFATVGAAYTNKFFDTNGKVIPVHLWPKKITWTIGSHVQSPKGFVNCGDDCPPVPNNKQDCCYVRDVDEKGKKKYTCSLKCNN
jgi:hypothetical protein